jgi:hypothetical protein
VTRRKNERLQFCVRIARYFCGQVGIMIPYEVSTKNSAKGSCSSFGHFIVHLAGGPAGAFAYPEPERECTVQPADFFRGVLGKGCVF